MAKLLHIFAHPRPEKSQTMRIARAFIEGYRETHPDDMIEEVDLYNIGVPHLTAAHLTAMAQQGKPEEMVPEVAAAWAEMMKKISQFTSGDKYVITTPMWNLGAPSILKAYIDHIMLAGYTFRYTGPGASVGMMTDRPMVLISTRGGNYTTPPMIEFEMCLRFLRNVFDFLGFNITHELVAEGLALVGMREQDVILQPVIAKARGVAATF